MYFHTRDGRTCIWVTLVWPWACHLTHCQYASVSSAVNGYLNQSNDCWGRRIKWQNGLHFHMLTLCKVVIILSTIAALWDYGIVKLKHFNSSNGYKSTLAYEVYWWCGVGAGYMVFIFFSCSFFFKPWLVRQLVKCFFFSWVKKRGYTWASWLVLQFRMCNLNYLRNIFFLFHQNIYCGYPLDLSHAGSCNKYSQNMIHWRNLLNSLLTYK